MLSVIVLCYRAEEQFFHVVPPLDDALAAMQTPYELVLVANYWPGENDRTPALAEEYGAGRRHVRTVVEPKRGDMGWDFRAGLAAARGRYLVVIDGDGQVPVHYAGDVYRELAASEADIVKGRRYAREDGSVRTLTSLGYNTAFRLLFGTRGLWDINGRPKGMTRAAYEKLELETDDWFPDAVIVLKARERGLAIRELPVRFLRNEARASFVGVDTVREFAVNMVRWRLGRHPAQRRTGRRVGARGGLPLRRPR